MNERARELGLTHTRFANPIGLDAPGNHSTALDLSRLARRVLRNDFLAATVDMPRARLFSGARPRIVANRNRLVREVPWVDGVKTGHTGGAGYVLVGSDESQGRAARERRARRAVRGRARRRHAARCCATGSRSTGAHGPCAAGATLSTASVEYFGDREVRLVPARPRVRHGAPGPAGAHRGARPRSSSAARSPAGARVGTVTVYRGGPPGARRSRS